MVFKVFLIIFLNQKLKKLYKLCLTLVKICLNLFCFIYLTQLCTNFVLVIIDISKTVAKIIKMKNKLELSSAKLRRLMKLSCKKFDILKELLKWSQLEVVM